MTIRSLPCVERWSQRRKLFETFARGAAKYQSREISDLNIHVYGNSAVVTGRAIQKGMENGKDYSGDYWFTRVYVNQGGHWMTVALQTTLIKQFVSIAVPP